MNIEKFIKTARTIGKMCGVLDHPKPHHYYVTSMQMGNLSGEQGWELYLGYVVQIRKGVGQFGSDLVLMRHPNGKLWRHENQSFFMVPEELIDVAKGFFEEELVPGVYDTADTEYTIGSGYPATGLVIEKGATGMEAQGGCFSMVVTKC